MFRVMIADDELSVIDSLVHSVQWEELELEVAGTASDGNKALALAREQGVEIAILDIRMPGLNGLELCERLRAVDEHIQLIIISGYAEFAYAEKAISFGVTGYCLKPLDYVQVTRCLRKAVQSLNQFHRFAIREDLMEILQNGSGEKINRKLGSLGFVVDRYYTAASVGERLDAPADKGISLCLGRGQWGYLIKRESAFPDRAELEEMDGWKGISYMPETVPAKDIYTSLEECLISAYQFFLEEKRCICPRGEEHRVRWMDMLYQKIQNGRWEQIPELLEQIMEKGVPDFTVKSALQLHNVISAVTSYQPLTDDTDSCIYSVEDLVSEYGTFRNMLQQMLRQVEDMGQPETEAAYTNSAFMKLLRYVNENYRGDISLTSAARVLYMNPNYISQLFKKEAGVTFVRYITQKRLEDAKELLVNTDKPLSDIAIEVGFNDYFYFIKTFKRFTGLTPSQFREQN